MTNVHYRIMFCFFQFVHFLLFIAIANEPDATLLMSSGVLNMLCYGLLLRLEFLRSPGLISPFVVFILSGFFRLGTGACWTAGVIFQKERQWLMVGPADVYAFLMDGYALLLLGDMLIILGYAVFDASKNAQQKPSPVGTAAFANPITFQIIIKLLFVGWVLKLALLFNLPGVRSSVAFSSFATSMPNAGLLLLFLYSSKCPPKLRLRGYSIGAVFLLINMAIGMNGYMKSSVILAGLPLLIDLASSLRRRADAVLRSRNRKRLVSLVILGTLVVLIIFPYFQSRRASIKIDMINETAVLSQTGVLEHLKYALKGAIPGSEAFSETHRFPRGGVWHFFGRQSYISSSAWAFSWVAKNGNVNGDFIYQGLVSLVPRILWKNKPIYNSGAQVSSMMGSFSDAGAATSATDAGGLPGGVYLNFGWIGLVLGCLVNGMLFSMFNKRFSGDVGSSAISATGLMMLYIGAALGFSNGLDGNVGIWGPLMLLAVANRIC